MKFKIILLLTLCFSHFTFAQDIDTLKEEAEKIYQATISMSFENVIESTYPKLFELVSREQMKELLIATFTENEEMKITLINIPANFRYGTILKIEDQSFCMVDHDLKMELKLSQTVAEEEIEIMTEMMKEAMETNEISFNKKNNTFSVFKKATMIAIADAITQNKWKFINKDKNNVMVNKLLSEKVIQELGM